MNRRLARWFLRASRCFGEVFLPEVSKDAFYREIEDRMYDRIYTALKDKNYDYRCRWTRNNLSFLHDCVGEERSRRLLISIDRRINWEQRSRGE